MRRAERGTPLLLRTVLKAAARRPRAQAPSASRSAAHLDAIVDAFFCGYAAALGRDGATGVAERLTRVPYQLQGFAYEGSAMALALVDWLWPVRPTRVRRFIDGPGSSHVYMVHVGVGWAAAKLRRAPTAARAGLNPIIDWLAVDGYGFHEGFFHMERTVRHHSVPRGLNGYAQRAFDQGLGRSLWFVEACDPDRVGHTISRFETGRRADLWSGVGLAATYAGALCISDLEALRTLAGPHRAHLAQGALFAAEARVRAGNVVAHTEDACAALAGMAAEPAAAIVRRMRLGLLDSEDLPAYELWRRRLTHIMEREI